MAEASESNLASVDETTKEIQSMHSSTSTSSNHDFDMEKQESDGESDRIEVESVTSVRGPGNGKGKGVMGKVMSRISTRSSWKDPGPPPDGGLIGWTQGL